MFISFARRKLHAAIGAATNPSDIAQLAIALSRLIDAEGRARGRRQRQRLRVEGTKTKQLPDFDPRCRILFGRLAALTSRYKERINADGAERWV